MHVAFFCPAWETGAHTSGIVTYVRAMRDELMRQGHRVSVFTDSSQPASAGIYPVIASKARVLSSWLRGRLQPDQPPVLRWGEVVAKSVSNVHRSEPIDVLEMEESFGWFASVCSTLPVPTVVKLHGPAFMTLVEEDARTPIAAAKIEAESAALGTCRVLTAPSQRTLDATIARFGLAPAIARRIANPLSLPTRAPIWDSRRCEPETLLFVGRFDKLKGGDIVLNAFARLLARNPRLTLIFVGVDAGLVDERGRRVHAADMISSLFPGDASARVVCKGKLSSAEICLLRAQAFTTIVASRWENQSYTLLEAMLQGCPVVTSDVGGQGEAVRHGHTGLLCKVADPEDLAAKVQELLDHPEEAARLGAAARRYALAEHSPQAVVAKTLEVYRDAIALAHRGKSSAALHA